MSGYTFIPGKITWSWNAPAGGATGYYLYASRVDNPTSEYYIGATTSASYAVSQFKPYTAGTFDYLIDGWPEPWNARYKLRVVAYKTVGDGTATSQSSDTAASSVEKPLSASYSNITNNSFSVQAQSGERGDSWGCTNPALAMCRQPFWFSYLTPNSSGVRLQAREIDNDVVSTSSWLKDNGTIAYGAYSLPPLWTVSGLTPNTTYNIYGQSRNQDAVSGRLGDYRPGPTDTDWQSLGTCSTTNVAAVNYTLTLTVVKLGTGTGTISAIPAGTPAITNTDCGPGGTCTASYATGNNVALSTAAGASSVFSGWSGDCTGTGVCDITMTANHNITATFAATGPANQPPGAPIFEPRP